MAKDLNRHFFKNRKKVFHESLICIYKMIPFAYSFLKDFIYLFLERGEGRERERNIDVRETSVASCMRLHLGSNPQLRHVPDWEWNQQPCALRNHIQPSKLPGLGCELPCNFGRGDVLTLLQAFGLWEWMTVVTLFPFFFFYWFIWLLWG